MKKLNIDFYFHLKVEKNDCYKRTKKSPVCKFNFTMLIISVTLACFCSQYCHDEVEECMNWFFGWLSLASFIKCNRGVS